MSLGFGKQDSNLVNKLSYKSKTLFLFLEGYSHVDSNKIKRAPHDYLQVSSLGW